MHHDILLQNIIGSLSDDDLLTKNQAYVNTNDIYHEPVDDSLIFQQLKGYYNVPTSKLLEMFLK